MKLAQAPLLIAGILGAAPFTVGGQASPVQRGSIQLGGTAAFTRTRDIGNDNGWVTLELQPRVGYFVVKGLAVSANLRYRVIWNDDQATVRDQRFTDWGVGPGLTYFFTTKSPRVFPFISGRTLFVRSFHTADLYSAPGDETPSVPDNETRTRTRNWQVSAGIMYMVVKHVGITGEVFYQRSKVTVGVDRPEESSNEAELYGLQWGIAAFVF
jgi:hypothetical protein